MKHDADLQQSDLHNSGISLGWTSASWLLFLWGPLLESCPQQFCDLQRNISLCSCSSVIVIFQISTEIHFHHISVMSSITAGFLGMKIFCSNPGHNINFNLFQSPAQVLAHRLWATDALSGALSPVQIHKHQPSPVSSRLSWSACYKDLRSTIAGLCLLLTCQNVIMMMMP